MIRISLIFGTRPEAIKLAPVIRALREHAAFEPRVCVTGQHREMLRQTLEAFEIKPDVDLDLMQTNQTLADLTSRAISALDHYFDHERPELVLVQGDTTTTFAASLAAFYHRVRVGHVEAGLRTGDKYSPFPEEINRVLTTRLADYHFASTEQARRNLLAEGVAPERIFLTGNTVIDALEFALGKVRKDPPAVPGLPSTLMEAGRARGAEQPLVLITGHRRENFGAGFESICQAVVDLSERFPETAFVYPVHLNPNVREPVFRRLTGRRNVFLIEPLSYLPFVALMDRATLILTDSGGVQEEAPSLGKPVLVMRDTTERPEAVAAGAARLIGTQADQIIAEVSRLLTDPSARAAMAQPVNPYGDGQASARIIQALLQREAGGA
jgi:UDP-N-acetylglucosamine 2-epimerase (non-hydrolysing)